ncbi:hypothetical protein I316_02228 [Kwoniella heveanensis BCC8398]|uniref:C2H2-type domain-containing protein n=1 Tax=Kwoniella heveanensis BCC8398 TaxID=1296120 RepID=A0A1B9GXI1_9TREE|nr:hypothetical protein I316_02228 [Kwoniella heveanensis BCC8398]
MSTNSPSFTPTLVQPTPDCIPFALFPLFVDLDPPSTSPVTSQPHLSSPIPAKRKRKRKRTKTSITPPPSYPPAHNDNGNEINDDDDDNDPGYDSDATVVDDQLVNDHNHVGPGHDFQARPHICNYADCDKAFARKSDLARHFRIHTNDRPFVCEYRGCGKSFIQRSALTVHFRTHTGERPHSCETCEKRFADSSSLARHRRIHTGMRPYNCRVPGCGKHFARRNTLLKHFKRTHPSLPPPSTSSQRPSIHGPVVSSRASSGSFLSSGSIGINGEYYLATPSSAGAAHGFATLHPSEGAAYSFHGGFNGSVFGGTSGSHSTFLIPSGGAFGKPFQQSPQAPGSATLTPISTSGAQFENQTPSTPCTGVLEEEGKPQIQQGGPTSAHPGLSPSPGAQSHGLGYAQYPSPLSAYPQSAGYPLTRFPSDGGGVIYTDKQQAVNLSQRSVSNPLDAPRFQPYTAGPFGHVGGGFHHSQLAIPPGQQHLMPSYHHPMHYAIQQPVPGGEEKPQVPHSPDGSSSDEDADEPLVSLHDNPTFAIHPPNGPLMHMPFSAVESANFGHLPPAQPQVLIASQQQNGRLHSAPPTMQRFNSLPTVPTMGNWGPIEQYQTHSATSANSADDEEWEDLAGELISREASVADDTQMTTASVLKEAPTEGEDVSHWGQPISYPIPPRDNQKNPFSSAASSSSTASTLVASSIHGSVGHSLPPISVYTAHPNQPMALTPINPNGYYTPITPAASWMHDQMKPHGLLEQHGHFQPNEEHDQENDPSQDITLTTPPKWGDKKDGRTVSAVGLGIANVHFDDRENDLAADDREWRDDDDAMASDDESAGDGSDDEFVLGRKQKKKARRSTGGGRGRGGVRGGSRKGRKTAHV